MTLEERYRSAETRDLIVILEAPEDYTVDCVRVVKEELERRNLPDEEIIEVAKELVQAKVDLIFKKFTPYDKITLPSSTFVPKEDIKEMLREAYNAYMGKRGDMEFDVWLYSFPAGV